MHIRHTQGAHWDTSQEQVYSFRILGIKCGLSHVTASPSPAEPSHQSWPGIPDSPTSASSVFGVTGMYHDTHFSSTFIKLLQQCLPLLQHFTMLYLSSYLSFTIQLRGIRIHFFYYNLRRSSGSSQLQCQLSGKVNERAENTLWDFNKSLSSFKHAVLSYDYFMLYTNIFQEINLYPIITIALLHNKQVSRKNSTYFSSFWRRRDSVRKGFQQSSGEAAAPGHTLSLLLPQNFLAIEDLLLTHLSESYPPNRPLSKQTPCLLYTLCLFWIDE